MTTMNGSAGQFNILDLRDSLKTMYEVVFLRFYSRKYMVRWILSCTSAVTSATRDEIFFLRRDLFCGALWSASRHSYHHRGVCGDGQGRPWPSQSRSAMFPSELPTPPRPSAHQGGSRQDRVPSTRGRPEEQIMVAISFSKDLVGKFTLFFHFFVYPKWFRGTNRNDAAPVQHP